MTILYLTDASSPHSRRWIEAFKDFGFEVHVITFRQYDMPGVNTYHLSDFGIGKLGYVLNIFKIKKIILKITPDIVHAHHVTSYGFIGALINPRNLIITTWGSDILIAPQKSFILKKMTSFALSRARFVTTVAEFMNSIALQYGARSEHIKSINFGVNLDHFNNDMHKSIDSEPLRIINTRNFSPIYDILTFVKALKILKDRNFCFQAVLVGDGPMRAQIENEISIANLWGNVELKGHCDYKKLPELLKSCDIFITTSLSDGNNVSLTEAMACGCFPIASDIQANKQWINDGVNGLLFSVKDYQELAEKILIAANNRNMIKNAISVNRSIVLEKANWKNSFTEMLSLYENLIE